MASNIVLEVYDLCADKAMLEYALQEEQEKARLYNTELDNLGAEYEVMVQNYAEELAASSDIKNDHMLSPAHTNRQKWSYILCLVIILELKVVFLCC